MYKKKVDARELTKQRNLDLYNTIEDKIFICKKDIPCKNGTFMRGTPVFLDTDEKASIGRLYDVTQWSSCIVNTFDYTNCFNDYSIKRITKKELPKYFEYNQELTLAYRDRKRMIGKQENDDEHYYHQERIALTYVITVITAFISALVFAGLKLLNIALLTVGIIVIADIVLMYAWISGEKRIKDKADFIKAAKMDLRELAYRGESREILCPTYKSDSVRGERNN